MKTAIVTGGGTGIGAATAMVLSAAGYRTIAVGLEKDESLSTEVEFIQLNVTDEKAVKEAFSSYGDLAVLVNCAGIIRHDLEWNPADFAAVLNVNLTSVLSCSQAAFPALKQNQGGIVNVASMWSQFGAAGAPGYGASKGGVVALTRSMAVAWAHDGVRVNAVAPGWIETKLASKAKNDPQRSARIGDRIPIGRWGKPDDIAKAIRFLVSDDAAYITGAVLPVDGGYSVA